MQTLTLLTGLGMLLTVSGSQAEPVPASVTISAPAEGAVLTAFQPVKVNYTATPGPKGDHLHIYIDGFQAGELRQLTGEHVIKMLHPGGHKISVEIVTQDHKPIGVGKTINVDVRY